MAQLGEKLSFIEWTAGASTANRLCSPEAGTEGWKQNPCTENRRKRLFGCGNPITL